MKNINFQKSPSIFRLVNENQVKKPMNWDRIIYLSILIMAMAYFSYYLFNKFFYIHAKGQVQMESVNIRLTKDIQIVAFRVSEGEVIRTGDTLFEYIDEKDMELINNQLYNSSDESNWVAREIYSMKRKIGSNKIEIANNNQIINGLKKENLMNEVILSLAPKTKLEELNKEIFRLTCENEKMMAENKEINEYIKKIPAQLVNKNAFLQTGLTARKKFLSPIEGLVVQINFRKHETALRSESVMSIQKKEKLTIKAFFEQENVKHFKEGDEVDVNFPDGITSKGIIKKLYTAAASLPEEFQNRYEPLTLSISADIYPLNEHEEKKWRTFYRMSVEIRKSKFN